MSELSIILAAQRRQYDKLRGIAALQFVPHDERRTAFAALVRNGHVSHLNLIPVANVPNEAERPELRKLKRLAARCGRAIQLPASEQAPRLDKLYEYMQTFDTETLQYYSAIVMLVAPNDHAGATGTGGFWAAATAAVNTLAARILRERRLTASTEPLFQEI